MKACAFGLVLQAWAIRLDGELSEQLTSDGAADTQNSASEDWLVPAEKCRVKGESTSSLFRRSCSASWGASGRCAWAGGGCMTNCLHSENRHQELCDAQDCVWDAAARTCGFAEGSTPGRTDFCGRAQGVLSLKQFSFCDGVPTTALTELQPMAGSIDIQDFMGCWYVQANIPTFLDAGSTNNVELYRWNEKESRIDVTFQYTKDGKDTLSYQKGWVDNEQATLWRLHPRLLWVFWPFNLPYVLTYVAEDFSSAIVGYPDRSYLWIMTREVHPDAAEVERLINMAVDQGYKREDINMVANDIPETPKICPQ